MDKTNSVNSTSEELSKIDSINRKAYFEEILLSLTLSAFKEAPCEGEWRKYTEAKTRENKLDVVRHNKGFIVEFAKEKEVIEAVKELFPLCINCGEVLESKEGIECGHCSDLYYYCKECNTSGYLDDYTEEYPCGHAIYVKGWQGIGADEFDEKRAKEALYNYLYPYRRTELINDLIFAFVEKLLNTTVFAALHFTHDYNLEVNYKKYYRYSASKTIEENLSGQFSTARALLETTYFSGSDEWLKKVIRWLLYIKNNFRFCIHRRKNINDKMEDVSLVIKLGKHYRKLRLPKESYYTVINREIKKNKYIDSDSNAIYVLHPEDFKETEIDLKTISNKNKFPRYSAKELEDAFNKTCKEHFAGKKIWIRRIGYSVYQVCSRENKKTERHHAFKTIADCYAAIILQGLSIKKEKK